MREDSLSYLMIFVFFFAVDTLTIQISIAASLCHRVKIRHPDSLIHVDYGVQ